jgi:hypothetical protein
VEFLNKKYFFFHNQIGQMAYEAIAQNSLEKSLNKTNDDLRKQIGQMLEKEKLHIGTINDLRAKVERQAKEVN